MQIPYEVSARPDTGLYNAKLGIWLFLASEVMLFGALFTSYLMLRLGAEDGTWPLHILSVPLGLINTFLLVVSSITMVYAWVALKERKLGQFRLWTLATILLAVAFLCIKADEYYDKYQHWGFNVKQDVFAANYQHDLDARHAKYTEIPSQNAVEVTGHLHEIIYEPGFDATSENAAAHIQGYKIAPDPKFVAVTTALTSKAEPQPEGDETITIAKADTIRRGNFLPSYDTFFGIYFTITGLHALHIIGGVVCMLYFVGPGVHIYRKNPEHMANRIEVFGIFWHFVDLVWITAFPILYLL